MLISGEGQKTTALETSTVSIVLPVYNDQDTIAQSLTSLIDQSYRNLEIIVVNDGSTDETRSIVQQITKNDPRSRVVDIEHAGTSAAKNSGFLASRGPIVFFAEGDAIYSDDYVLRSVSCLQNDSKIGGVCVLGGIWEVRRTFVTRCIEAENKIKHAQIHRGKMEPFYAWVFTREALEKSGLYDVKLKQAEDRDLFARVKAAGFEIGLVEGVHWRHRRFETTWQFFVKNLRKGRNRVRYMVEKGRSKEFAKGVGGLWVPVALAIISVAVADVSWVLLLSIVAFVGYFYGRVSLLGRGSNLSVRQFLELPLYQILRYISSALGYTFGLLTYPFRPNNELSPATSPHD